MSLMQRPARDLAGHVSDSVWLRLGQGMARCVDQFATVLRGVPEVEDPDYMANVLWTQMLGAMHLARIRVGVRQAAPGVPELFRVEPERIVRSCVDSVMTLVS